MCHFSYKEPVNNKGEPLQTTGRVSSDRIGDNIHIMLASSKLVLLKF